MKKILVVMLTLSVIAFASCNNENNVTGLIESDSPEFVDSTLQQVQQNMELLKVQKSIHIYNNDVFGSYTEPETRGLFKFLRSIVKVIATVAADAVGGAVGGVAGGVAASGIVGGALLFNVTDVAIVPMPNATRAGGDFERNDLFYDKNIVFDDIVPLNRNNENDSVGYYHNKVLYGLFLNEDKAEKFVALDKNQQANMIVQEMAKEPYLKNRYGNELNDVEKVNKGVETAEAVIKIAEEVESEEEFFARLAEIGLTDPNVIAVMKEIINGLENTDPTQDDGQYYQKVLDIVETSSLDSNMKTRLSDGIIIGQASNHLWKRVDLDVNDEDLMDFGTGDEDPDVYK